MSEEPIIRKKTKLDEWNVYLHGKNIDTVFTDAKCNGGAQFTAEMVRDGLGNHDGYDPRIRVVKVK